MPIGEVIPENNRKPVYHMLTHIAPRFVFRLKIPMPTGIVTNGFKSFQQEASIAL